MKNQYKVTPKLLRQWLTENMYKGIQLALNIGWAVLGIFSIVMMIFASDSVDDYIVYGVILLLCVYMGWLRIFLLAAVQYKRMAKVYGEQQWTRTITFSEEGITLCEGTISASYRYEDIMSIREKENKIWLTARNRTVLWLYKDAFTDGSWEECRELLTQRSTAEQQ